MGNAAGMIAQARALLGTTEHPPGSNHNPITEFIGFDGPWCEMSITFEAAHSDNLPAIFGRFANTVVHAREFQRHGRWHFGLGGARPGDVVFFDWSGTRVIDNIDHVGLIEAVHSNGTITTLEGNTSDAFLRRVRNAACVVGYGRPAYGDAAPMPGDDGILRQGSKGNAVKALQQDLNKVMGSQLAVDGDFGPATKVAVETFQRKHGLTADGEYGPQSAAMMRAGLAGKGAPIQPTPTPPTTTTLAVDGKFEPATCAAMQRALNQHGAKLTVDGAFGPLTKKAVQKLLNVTQDGEIGPQTVIALQKHVGAAPDGDWGPDTTRHLQTALNAGKF
jgi:peptidoglycan hydrolase-like protein with peptidoglycan-binding domain